MSFDYRPLAWIFFTDRQGHSLGPGPEIVENIFGEKDAFLRSITLTASRITSRNASVFWESERNGDMVFEFLKNKIRIDGASHIADIHRYKSKDIINKNPDPAYKY
jgi:hypothetical protein